MISWYFPTTASHWCRRQITLRATVILLIIVGAVFTEFRFDWLEKAVGGYLVSTNGARPESGTAWDQGKQSILARQTLESFVNKRRNTQREARGAESLGQLMTTISKESGAMISAEHFAELYLKLPPVLAQEVISPYTILALMSSGQWQRTFFEQQDQQQFVYLLDGNNQVLHRLAIGPALLAHIRRGDIALETTLDTLDDFNLHIFAAERFFTMLNSFPASVRKGVIANPEELLRVSGRIVRVGISSNAITDSADLAFEVESVDGPKVILMKGRREDVQRLQGLLEGRTLFNQPMSNRLMPGGEH